ncbi:hypothetical protein ORI20_06010 [Mycobacterium sp. CVI_P3]|uniref:Uncharacterized protein n=1 Tax=Mycobacterium pinniadriaticum TaxID=2994102 RepID=A0ABT3SCA9_9MYCO|nr:hypothetical protein [Mycobacterium pinniadriaticum]MCX2929816.1 hypothetical protein [Mycobacterium pinniadriaticum]MCX2936535.1 hypothetical protein [Mycobacterium pinniadriaticum]
MTAGWDRARTIADAVLYEGYLLYPYRASSRKNQCRWQFGVLGPAGAAAAGIGEETSLDTQFLVADGGSLTLVVRFLQLQHRQAERRDERDWVPVDELVTPGARWLSWDEAVECEITFGPVDLDSARRSWSWPLTVPGGTSVEDVDGGRLVRTRRELHGAVTVDVDGVDGLDRVSLTIVNTGPASTRPAEAIAGSLIGTHVIAEISGGRFVSLLEPPPAAAAAAAACRHNRCFPVLAGAPGEDHLLLVSPIILYDHPEVAEQSEGDLFDSTEIDEILTLRVMTMTDEEKAQARATDPRAAAIIARCDAMSPDAMQRLHGVLRDPRAETTTPAGLIPDIPDGVDWWDPSADTEVRPEVDAVLIDGVRVARGSRVRLQPNRRADAQDIFVAGRTARVTSVHADVDGNTHVAVVVEDDPAADLHDWYGRYLYFAPDEVEPLDPESSSPERSSTWQS